jgi:hypothetical protein
MTFRSPAAIRAPHAAHNRDRSGSPAPRSGQVPMGDMLRRYQQPTPAAVPRPGAGDSGVRPRTPRARVPRHTARRAPAVGYRFRLDAVVWAAGVRTLARDDERARTSRVLLLDEGSTAPNEQGGGVTMPQVHGPARSTPPSSGGTQKLYGAWALGIACKERPSDRFQAPPRRTIVQSLSDDAGALPDCSNEKDLQYRPSLKRLMGFEPTTFCMASSRLAAPRI